MNQATLIVATYMNPDGSGELVTFFRGESAESAFATWLRVVGVSALIKVDANP